MAAAPQCAIRIHGPRMSAKVVSLDDVGRVLSQETFALALAAGLDRHSVEMTVNQQVAIALFEGLGFKAEALLRDHVRDVAGRKHDIGVLGHNVAEVRVQMKAYGLPGVGAALMETTQ